MFRIDFSEKRQSWADSSERELLLNMSRTGEIHYGFNRRISITSDDRDLSIGGWTPVFGLASELGYALSHMIKNHTEIEYFDADSWPMELRSVGNGSVALTTYSWIPLEHGSQIEDEDGTYLIGTAKITIDEFSKVLSDFLARFHTHLRNLYSEARGNSKLDKYVASLKRNLQ